MRVRGNVISMETKELLVRAQLRDKMESMALVEIGKLMSSFASSELIDLGDLNLD